MFLETVSRQLEQNHRASGAFINNDNIEEKRWKKKKQTENTESIDGIKNVLKKGRYKIQTYINPCSTK